MTEKPNHPPPDDKDLSDGMTVFRKRPKPLPPKKEHPPEWAIKQLVPYTHKTDVAERLLKTCKTKNPVKSWVWVTNKVLGDLMRDNGFGGQRPTVHAPVRSPQNTAQMSQRNAAYSPVVGWVLLLGILSFGTAVRQVPPSIPRQGTGYGEVSSENLMNFSPPGKYQQIGGSQVQLRLVNGSPDALTITGKTEAGQTMRLTFPGCRECRAYDRDELPECGTVGQWQYFTVPPGTYKVTGLFSGTRRTRGFKSQWSLEPGWEYNQCVYTLNEPQYY